MIYSENVVKILRTWHFFFYSFLDFETTSPPPPPIFGNGIATISLSQFFFHLYFGNAIVTIFFSYFGNAIATATISLSQNFFSPISVMALPQLVCHNFFSPISVMALPQTNCKIFFNDTCTQFLQQILNARLLLLD